MARKAKTTMENSNNSILTSIRMKDGTELSVILNGTTYESEDPVPEGTFTDENMSEVTINGTVYHDLKLICSYQWNGGTRFVFRKMALQEIENRNLKLQLQAAQESVAELTIIVSGLMM